MSWSFCAMRHLALRRDIVFYPLICAAWGIFMVARYAGYTYFASPLPAVKTAMQVNQAFYKTKMLDKSIEELQASLETEEQPGERGHIEHNIGTAYYDRYKATKDRTLLDSAQQYYERSIETLPTVARFYYNLGRIFTERRRHPTAKTHYERSLELNPKHVLALHNLALLNFYELGDRKTAKVLLERALAIRHDLPICNYVLGEIALQQGQYEKALNHFRTEVNYFAMHSSGKQSVPVSGSAMRFAASKSHLELAI
ncbi:MAG: tetratricopeptide repeat protein, partial [Chitinivibrionales bacterium]|nr:tetratricopeptide repeat protein [Chitinivibrionales bacterium]MBD3395695.1 tetratricopeptide repeat protein [Chitinivibrionales bacterium]